MEPMVTINLESYNKLLKYESIITELLEKSKKDIRSEIVPGFGVDPKRTLYMNVSKEALKSMYSTLLGINKEDIKVTLGD